MTEPKPVYVVSTSDLSDSGRKELALHSDEAELGFNVHHWDNLSDSQKRLVLMMIAFFCEENGG